jgi:ABC-type sugar transport system ATPase subunit
MKNGSVPAVQLAEVSKVFPGVLALDRVSFDVEYGEIHALVGENGAGKSTLVKLLAGLLRPDGGDILLGGRKLILHNPREARTRGISVIPQEVEAVPDLSAGRNILLGMEGIFSARERLTADERARVRRALERAGASLDESRRAGDLSAPELRLCQIARTLIAPGSVMVLDEPTAVLSEADAEHLLDRLLAFRDEGRAIVYVSHRLSEVLRISDRVTVLRDGKALGTFARTDVDRERIIAMMAKDEVSERPVAVATATAPRLKRVRAEPLLEVESLSSGKIVTDVSFTLRPGEIVGIAGVQGSGHGYLLGAVAGRFSYDSGTVRVRGRVVPPGSVRSAYGAGLLLVPADRRQAGIVSSLAVRDNVALPRGGPHHRFGFRRRRIEATVTRRYIRGFSIRTPGIEALAGQLSGGNQQKLALARAVESNPKVFLLEEPTQGIDVHAKSDIRSLIKQLVHEEGARAAVVATSEFEELLDLADLIHVMCLGRLVATLTAEEATYATILHHALP